MSISTGDVRVSRRIRTLSVLAAAGLASFATVGPAAAQAAPPAASDDPSQLQTIEEIAAAEAPDEPVELGPVVAPAPEVEPETWLAFEPNEDSDYELPSPTEFDLEKTTFTEVEWIRTDLVRRQFLAVVVDINAASQLAEARALTAARTNERDVALEHLEFLTLGVQAAAIDGYLNDNSARATELLAPDLQTLGNADLSEFTTTQLVSAREQAQVEYDAAEVALADAEALEYKAENIKDSTAAAVLAIGEEYAAFEDRAERHAAEDAAADRVAARLDPVVELGSVVGFNVNVVLEDALDALIAHARVDGIELGGGSFRTIESQIALRLAHCGGTTPPSQAALGADATPDEVAAANAAVAAWRHHVIYEVPAGSCSPPTATPGNSEHQLGLAIDFTDGAGNILTWDSPAFTWLVLNAGDYGLINLPSEAWHWSTTGR